MAWSWLPIIGPICERLFKGTKDLVEVRKNLTETEKAQLEIDKLEDEKSERQSEIQRATLEDVKKYDPKYADLEESIHKVRRMRKWYIAPLFLSLCVWLSAHVRPNYFVYFLLGFIIGAITTGFLCLKLYG